MPERLRTRMLVAAAVCIGVFALIAVLVRSGRGLFRQFDLLGERAQSFREDVPAATPVLMAIEWVTGPVGMTIIVAILVLVVAILRFYRAATYLAVAMSLTSLASSTIKPLVGRTRPTWQDSAEPLTSLSFPSGHSSAITVFTGVMFAFALVSARRRGVVLAAALGPLLMAIVFADRILLGRHYPTDVLAGAFLGAGVMLLVTAWLGSASALRRRGWAESVQPEGDQPECEPRTRARHCRS